MSCCKKTCPEGHANHGNSNYGFIVLIVFILLAIVVGSVGF